MSLTIPAYDGILMYLQKKDNVILTLVKKAKKDGLEVIDTEAINLAIRQEYPAAEEYIQSCMELVTSAIKLIHMLNTYGEPASETLEVYTNCVVNTYIDFFVKKEVKILYGEDNLPTLQP